MIIKFDLIVLLGTLPSVSGVNCSLWDSVIFKKVLISQLGLRLGIISLISCRRHGWSIIYYYGYKQFVMYSDPGNQLHWNGMYFQHISYWNVLPTVFSL